MKSAIICEILLLNGDSLKNKKFKEWRKNVFSLQEDKFVKRDS